MSNWNTQSLVTWNYSLSDNTGFLLQISRDSGSTWPNSVFLPFTTLFYYDNDVTWGDSRWYRVAATNDYGIGSPSGLAYVYINGGSIPWYPSLSPTIQAVQTTSSLNPTFTLNMNYQYIPYNYVIDDAFVGGWAFNTESMFVTNVSANPITVSDISIVGSGFINGYTSKTTPFILNTNDVVVIQMQKNVAGPQSASLVITSTAYDSPVILYLQGS